MTGPVLTTRSLRSALPADVAASLSFGVSPDGTAIGPDLSAIGKLRPREDLLESILEPSKSIDPKYVAYLAETTDGLVHTGLLAEKNDREVVLRTAGDKEVRIPAGKVATLGAGAIRKKGEHVLDEFIANLTRELGSR